MRYRLEDRIGHRISRTVALMHRYFDERCAPLGVTRISWTALASLGFEGVDTPSALAAHMGINRPAASRLLRQLEADGLLARKPAKDDGRSVRLGLTEAGRAKLDAVFPHADATNRHFSGKLTGAELTELYRLLDKLAAGEPPDISRL
jgi:DNA-binding MarR family transcriptional regulator